MSVSSQASAPMGRAAAVMVLPLLSTAKKSAPFLSSIINFVGLREYHRNVQIHEVKVMEYIIYLSFGLLISSNVEFTMG